MTKEETKQKNIKISVEGYGPIAKAKNVEIYPLTIFAGPSNTGKSYLAILVYSLFNTLLLAENHASSIKFSRPMMRFLNDEKVSQFGEEILKSMIKNENEDITFSSLPKNSQKWLEDTLLRAIRKDVYRDISRCTGASMEDLLRKDFKLSFEDVAKKIHLEQSTEKDSVQVKNSQLKAMSKRYLPYNLMTEKVKESSSLSNIWREEGVFIVNRVVEILYNTLFKYVRQNNAFYLPAARSGIMQSHKVIAGALVQRAAYAGFEALSVPTLSGVVADFLQGIIFVNEGRRMYRRAEHRAFRRNKISIKKFAEIMEGEILDGVIETEISGENKYPDFSYQHGDIKLPLLRSSSMVSELAPIVLFLRNHVSEGDLFIVEEPESHLHPEAQKKMARTMVRLVNEGVKVMVTTHSDYFLEQISNCVRRSALGNKNKNTPSIKEEEVGIYSFKPGSKGTVVKKLRFDEQSGLSPEDHDKAASGLYNERVDILNQLNERELP